LRAGIDLKTSIWRQPLTKMLPEAWAAASDDYSAFAANTVGVAHFSWKASGAFGVSGVFE